MAASSGPVVFALLFFPPHDALLDEHIKGTVTGTVGALDAPGHPIPSPFVAIYVFKPPVELGGSSAVWARVEQQKR
jgi:hypothetical protein